MTHHYQRNLQKEIFNYWLTYSFGRFVYDHFERGHDSRQAGMVLSSNWELPSDERERKRGERGRGRDRDWACVGFWYFKAYLQWHSPNRATPIHSLTSQSFPNNSTNRGTYGVHYHSYHCKYVCPSETTWAFKNCFSFENFLYAYIMFCLNPLPISSLPISFLSFLSPYSPLLMWSNKQTDKPTETT